MTPSPMVIPQGIIIPGFRVTSVRVEASPGSSDGQHVMYAFTGEITVSGRGTVKYRWLRSDGGIAPTESLAFDASGTKRVTSTWTLGLTSSARELWKAIQVEEPSAVRSNEAHFNVPPLGFRVTHANVRVGPQASFEGECPTTFEFTGELTVEGKGTVRYRWVRSDGGKGPVKSLVFGSPGTLSLEPARWKRDGAPGTTNAGWQSVELLYPNHEYPPGEGSPTAVFPSPADSRFTMKCTSSTTLQKVAIEWSGTPTLTWIAANSSESGQPSVDWQAGLSIRNQSFAAIDGWRILVCSYATSQSGAWTQRPPDLPHTAVYESPNPYECLRESGPREGYFWLRVHPGSPSVQARQTVSLRVSRPVGVSGHGSSARSIVYIRAQVVHPDDRRITTSNWLRWELDSH